MAINYIKDISETNFLFSHNNNVIEFYSDSVEVIGSATIIINTKTLTLYPNPNGVFYFNFKDVVSSLINTNNYTDDLETDVSISYVYDWSVRVYLSASVEIQINFLNETSESDTKDLKFLLSAVNLRDYNKRFPIVSDIIEPFVLAPNEVSNNLSSYVKYFSGYPFDITLFNGIDDNSDIGINNLTNAISYTFTKVSTNKFVRLVFSDGRTNTTIEDVLPLVNGFNSLELISLDGIENKYINIEKETGCDGIYLKWLNDKGGYSYWLFRSNESSRKFKSLGYLQNDYSNLEDTTSQEVSLGYESNDSFKIYDNLLTENQKNLISTMLDSPKVYLFTGTPFSQNNFNDWMEIKLKQSNYVLTQVKRDNYNIAISFELPSNNNITV